MNQWLWWLIGTVGVSGALMIGVGLIFGWPVIIGTKLGRTALAILTAGIGLVILYAKARAEGAAGQRTKQEKENAEFLGKVEASDAADAQLSDDELDRRLRDNGNTGPR